MANLLVQVAQENLRLKIRKVKRCMLLLVAPACVGTLAKVLVRLRLVLPGLASPLMSLAKLRSLDNLSYKSYDLTQMAAHSRIRYSLAG